MSNNKLYITAFLILIFNWIRFFYHPKFPFKLWVRLGISIRTKQKVDVSDLGRDSRQAAVQKNARILENFQIE
jgi:hypothetical protein